MKTDTIIKSEGMNALFDKLGMVDAERFITLISKEKFDYTKWQKNLFENETVESLCDKAFDFSKE